MGGFASAAAGVAEGVLGAAGGSSSGGKKKKAFSPPLVEDFAGDSYKRGGKVKRTGPAKLHKGERVLTKRQAKKYDKKRGSKR